ncbi:hypothetical protein ACLB2K_063698 [Fragaria x ananassa]
MARLSRRGGPMSIYRVGDSWRGEFVLSKLKIGSGCECSAVCNQLTATTRIHCFKGERFTVGLVKVKGSSCLVPRSRARKGWRDSKTYLEPRRVAIVIVEKLELRGDSGETSEVRVEWRDKRSPWSLAWQAVSAVRNG